MSDSTPLMTFDLTTTLPDCILTLSKTLGCTEVEHVDVEPDVFELDWPDSGLFYLQVHITDSTFCLSIHAQDMDSISHNPETWPWSFEMPAEDDLSAALDFVRTWIKKAHQILTPAAQLHHQLTPCANLHHHLATHFSHEVNGD